jgi:Zinc-binding dehydrogenase
LGDFPEGRYAAFQLFEVFLRDHEHIHGCARPDSGVPRHVVKQSHFPKIIARTEGRDVPLTAIGFLQDIAFSRLDHIHAISQITLEENDFSRLKMLSGNTSIVHTPDKDKLIRELGADEVVRDGKNLAAAGGADIILSTSNSTKSMVDSIQGLRPDGRLVTMGADAEPLSISLMDLIMKRIRIIGSQQNGPEYLYEALDFVAQGKVKTIVETYPLAEAAKAYERVAEGRARFRAVLIM